MNQAVNNSACRRVARSTDLIFLQSFLNTATTSPSAKHRPLQEEEEEETGGLPVTHDSLRLVDQVKTIAEQRVYLDEAKELFTLLTNKSLQGLLEVHDEVAAHIQNSLEEVQYIDGVSSSGDESDTEDRAAAAADGGGAADDKEKSDSSEEIVDTFRVIGLRRKKGESLGLTVTVDDEGRVLVARIIYGSFIERQGLLRPGDVVLEANGVRITSPEQLQTFIEESVEFITLKVQPTLACSQPQPPLLRDKPIPSGKFYVRALYSYEPEKDSLLPCPQIGLPFKYGDILEVVSSQDPSWWQARLEQGDNIGLVPSLDLEERRKCFVEKHAVMNKFSCCGSGKKEKKKFGYHFRKNAQVDTADLQLYEAVERMPPFTRKTLVLVGPPGVGRRSLISRIVKSNPSLFATTKAVTSRPKGEYETDGELFWFLSEEELITSLDRDEFMEVTEQDGYLYGTTYQSIRSVISEGRLCVIDCKPESLKILHQSSEFLPFVIFLSAPSLTTMRDIANNCDKSNGDSHRIHSADDVMKTLEESHRIREEYQKYFDLEIPAEDFETCYRAIMGALDKLTTECQWVPLNWVYS